MKFILANFNIISCHYGCNVNDLSYISIRQERIFSVLFIHTHSHARTHTYMHKKNLVHIERELSLLEINQIVPLAHIIIMRKKNILTYSYSLYSHTPTHSHIAYVYDISSTTTSSSGK